MGKIRIIAVLLMVFCGCSLNEPGQLVDLGPAPKPINSYTIEEDNYEELYRWLKELNKMGIAVDMDTGNATYYTEQGITEEQRRYNLETLDQLRRDLNQEWRFQEQKLNQEKRDREQRRFQQALLNTIDNIDMYDN